MVRTAGGMALLGLVLTSPAGAWSLGTHREVAARAASISPADLARQVEKHQEALARGVARAWEEGQGMVGAEAARAAVRREVGNAIGMIEGHRPFAEIVEQLGLVAYWLGALNNPLVVSDDDPYEERYAADYLRYVEGAQERFSLVFYGPLPQPEERTDLETLLQRAVARGRMMYPYIGLEYRRVGAAGSRAFDDRSTAFGVASVAVSRAISDVALVFRHIWIVAGGMDGREGYPRKEGHLLLLPEEDEEGGGGERSSP